MLYINGIHAVSHDVGARIFESPSTRRMLSHVPQHHDWNSMVVRNVAAGE